jgi:hypothetical protein
MADEQECYENVKRDPSTFKETIHWSKRVCEAAIESGYCMLYELVLALIGQRHVIVYEDFDLIIRDAIRKDPMIVQDLRYTCSDPDVMAMYDSLVQSYYEYAVDICKPAIRYVNQTLEMQLAAVEEDPYLIAECYTQPEEVCLAAVKQKGDALRFIRSQTVEICQAAVENDPSAWIYINDSALRKVLSA